MKVALITTSRADYGIYKPLLLAMDKDDFFNLRLIVLGSHLSKKHGYTINEILKDGFEISHRIDHSYDDSPSGIVLAIAEISKVCSSIWNSLKQDIDLIICLGDRFEMHAVVYASLPFNIPVAHFHGGETSLGAIDNVYRNSLSMLAKYHFSSTDYHANRVSEMKDSHEHIYNVGSLSFDNLAYQQLLSISEFESKFNLTLNENTVLLTFHPETVRYEKNEEFARIICEAITSQKQFNFLITLPNADTHNHFIRKEFEKASKLQSHIQVTENLGTQGYFTCLANCKFVMGNSSSGIIEAAYFKKYSLDIGDRQKGRQRGDNVIHSPIVHDNLVSCMNQVSDMGEFSGDAIYHKKNPTKKVIQILKSI